MKEGPLEIWLRLFPSLGGGWPERDIVLAEVGLGVRLPAPLRDFLVATRPPDGVRDFRDLRLLGPDDIAWSSESESEVLVFAEMADTGLQFGIDAAALRDDPNPIVLSGDGPLPVRLTRWLEEYAYLMRVDAPPTTEWTSCSAESVQALQAEWRAVAIDWNPVPVEQRSPPPFRGMRSITECTLYVRDDAVAELVSTTEIIVSAVSLPRLEAALASIGMNRALAR